MSRWDVCVFVCVGGQATELSSCPTTQPPTPGFPPPPLSHPPETLTFQCASTSRLALLRSLHHIRNDYYTVQYGSPAANMSAMQSQAGRPPRPRSRHAPKSAATPVHDGRVARMKVQDALGSIGRHAQQPRPAELLPDLQRGGAGGRGEGAGGTSQALPGRHEARSEAGEVVQAFKEHGNPSLCTRGGE